MLQGGKLVLSNSEITKFLKCHREWGLNYIDRWAPQKEKYNFVFGEAIHSVLETFYLTGDETETLHKLDVVFNNHPQLVKDKIMAQKMVTGYFSWIDPNELSQVKSIEDTYECPVGVIEIDDDKKYGEFAENNQIEVVVRSKLDLVLEGDRIVDHKTTGTIASTYMSEWNLQARTYSLVYSLHEKNIPTFFFNYLRKVKQTKAAKPPFYKRDQILINQGILDNHRRLIMNVAREMLPQFIQHRRDKILTPSLSSYDCKLCQFRDVCPSLDDPELFTMETMDFLFKKQDPNERYNK